MNFRIADLSLRSDTAQARWLSPGVIAGFNPQPDPPGRPALGGPDTAPVARGIIVIGG